MSKALILVGKKEEVETYQLLIDCKYVYTSYDGSSQREPFFEEVAEQFAKTILDENQPFMVGTVNGLRIDPQTGKHEIISKLEEEIVAQLRDKITAKFMREKPHLYN